VITEALWVAAFLFSTIIFGSVFAAALGALVGRAAGLAVVARIAVRRYEFRIPMDLVSLELKSGFSFAVHAATAALYINIDILILSKFVSTYDLGIYQAGVRVMVAACILTLVAQNVFVPRFGAVFASPEEFHKLKRRLFTLNFAAGVLATMTVISLRDVLVNLLFGAAFADLVPLMMGFGVVVFLRYIGSAYGVLLTVLPKGQTIRAVSATASIGVVVVGNLVVAPQFGIYGAVGVMIGAHVFINSAYVLYWYVVGAPQVSTRIEA
jgi:O-antigen/teichoic acid export membrane protein